MQSNWIFVFRCINEILLLKSSVSIYSRMITPKKPLKPQLATSDVDGNLFYYYYNEHKHLVANSFHGCCRGLILKKVNLYIQCFFSCLFWITFKQMLVIFWNAHFFGDLLSGTTKILHAFICIFIFKLVVYQYLLSLR